jgi:hypothetical protein
MINPFISTTSNLLTKLTFKRHLFIPMQKLDFTRELTDDHKKEMEKHGGFAQDHIVEHYNDLAVNYEAIYLLAGFHDPKKCAELTTECFGLIGK